MNNDEIVIKKTPFLFLKYLVFIEFTFALLPFVATLIFELRNSYDQSAFAGMVSYNLLLVVVMTTLQVLIIAISFMTWYLPSYLIDTEKITYRRGAFFEDKKLIDIPAIDRIEVLQGGLARRLDYGSLAIFLPGGRDRVVISNIPNPANYADRIQGLLPTVKSLLALPGVQDVHELIAGGENQYVEFKSSLLWDYHQQKVNKNLYEPVMKNLTAFMNTTGGALLIGVDDDGRILGLNEDIKTLKKPNIDGFENVFNMAFNKMVGVEFRHFIDLAFPEVDGQTVCLVSVKPANQPVYLVHQGQEAFYIRAGNASQPLSVSTATSYIQNHFEL